MEEDKKVFYFLKLQRDFFQRTEVKLLEGQQNGKAYVLFYLKIMVESLANNGYLRLNDKIPYDVTMLATITNTDIDTVRAAVAALINMGLLTQTEDGGYFVEEVAKITGRMVDSPAAIRKRRQREREAEEAAKDTLRLPENGTNENVTNCHTEVTDTSHESVTKCHEKYRSIEVKKNRSIEVKKIEEEEISEKLNIVKPARGEIEDFISEHCPHIDAEGFYKYYDARGWQINGKPITDWRALADTWEKKMQVDTQQQISAHDQVKLFNKYRQVFGKGVPVEYMGNFKRIQLAIATETPL